MSKQQLLTSPDAVSVKSNVSRPKSNLNRIKPVGIISSQTGLAAKFSSDRGAATAEYVIATMAAVGFAGLLVVILRGDEVKQILTDMVRNALSIAG